MDNNSYSEKISSFTEIHVLVYLNRIRLAYVRDSPHARLYEYFSEVDFAYVYM